jgi:hypothetical protein
MLRHVRRAMTAPAPPARRALWGGADSDPGAAAAWMRRYVGLPERGRDALVAEEMKRGKEGGLAPKQLGPFEHLLSTTPGGAAFAIALRRDVLRLSHSKDADAAFGGSAGLKALDASLKKWLSVFIADDALVLETVTFAKSSGSTLEFIAQNEGVHSLTSITELKKRLSNGKRCFTLSHSNFKNDVLAFIHVAFTGCVSRSMSELEEAALRGSVRLPSDDKPSLASAGQGHNGHGQGQGQGQGQEQSSQPTCAMFYSVNSPLDAMLGLDLAGRIIKRVTEEIRIQAPSVSTFSTLSPIPGFLKFLRDVTVVKNGADLLTDFPDRYADEVIKLLGEYGEVDVAAGGAEGGAGAKPARKEERSAEALALLLRFLDQVADSPLMHMAIATESTADVISISNIHHKRGGEAVNMPINLAHSQDEMVNIYQSEQTKILRFAHLMDDTLSYDAQRNEVQVVDSGGDGADHVKPLSNITVKRLRETWQGLKKPVRRQDKTRQDKTIYCIVLYCTVLYCTILYCTILYCMHI